MKLIKSCIFCCFTDLGVQWEFPFRGVIHCLGGSLPAFHRLLKQKKSEFQNRPNQVKRRRFLWNCRDFESSSVSFVNQRWRNRYEVIKEHEYHITGWQLKILIFWQPRKIAVGARGERDGAFVLKERACGLHLYTDENVYDIIPPGAESKSDTPTALLWMCISCIESQQLRSKKWEEQKGYAGNVIEFVTYTRRRGSKGFEQWRQKNSLIWKFRLVCTRLN